MSKQASKSPKSDFFMTQSWKSDVGLHGFSEFYEVKPRHEQIPSISIYRCTEMLLKRYGPFHRNQTVGSRVIAKIFAHDN